MSSGCALHAEAFADDIRAYILDSPNASDPIMLEIFDAIRGLVSFPIRATGART